MKGFLANLYLRPSCHQCAAKFGKSGSDITIADFGEFNRLCPISMMIREPVWFLSIH